MKSKRKNIIIREAEFDKAFINFFNDDHKHIREFLNKKAERPFKEDYSYRVINHWEANNLLNTDRGKKGGGWRRFSIIDIIWINIISRLRKYGVSIDNIKKVKDSLSNFPQDKLGQFPQLEFFVASFFSNKHPFYLLVFENYEAELVTTPQLALSETSHQLDNFIRINIHEIIQKMYPKKDLSPKEKHSMILSDEELELLFMVRTEQFESITIIKRNGKIDRIDKTEYLDADRMVSSILSEGNYQQIKLFQSGGKVIKIRRTIQKKVK